MCKECGDCFGTGVQLMQGPQGPAGANGTNGTTGPTGAVGPQGPAGANGTNGTNGIGQDGDPGADGASIIHTDFKDYETVAARLTTASGPLIIPANTWENFEDVVEIELKGIGELYESGAFLSLDFHKFYITIDGNPIDISVLMTTLGAQGYIGAWSAREPYFRVRIQLVMTAAGTLTPMSESWDNLGDYASEQPMPSLSDCYDTAGKGAVIGGLALDTDLPLEVKIHSAHETVKFKQKFLKITSFKKITP